MKKFVLRIIMLVLCAGMLCACGEGKRNAEDTKGAEVTENTEKGYDLPIGDSERREAEADGRKVMELTADICREAGENGASEGILAEDVLSEMTERITKTGCPVRSNRLYSNMENQEVFENFLTACAEGKCGAVVIYEIHSDGSIGRCRYSYDGKEMYVLTANFVWSSDDKPVMAYISRTRLKEWRVTEKGWFACKLCVPEYPEVTEVVDGSCLIRVKPITDQNRELSEKYVFGLGYRGNNLLCSDWDADHLWDLDFNGMYEYLYAMKYEREFPQEDYSEGIPKDEFEHLIMEYLPVTAKEIQSCAVFDEEKQTYEWKGLPYSEHIATYFETSVPEVTDVRENSDGTITLKVDAVCSMFLCDDAVITHELTIQVSGDGSFRYLGNRVLNGGIRNIPEYQYRIAE